MKTSFKILSGASPVAIRRMWSLPMITVSARASALFVALVLAALALPAGAEANLITNGSFEQNTPYAVPPDPNLTYGPIAGWTYSGDSPAGAGSVWALTPPDGAYVSAIGGTSSFSAGRFTSAAAYLSLTAGQEYSLSFDATGIAAYNSNFSLLLPWEQFKMNLYYAVVYKGGPLLDTAMAEGSVFPVVGTWTTTNVTFTPTQSGPAAVNVYLLNSGWASNVASVYTAVDNFSVVAVPEPGALALAGIGIAAAALACRRRTSAP